MRLVRILLSLLILAFGFLVAMAVMLFGFLASLFGRRTVRPAFNVRFNRTGTNMPPRPTPPDRRHAGGDVIDIEATPVKD